MPGVLILLKDITPLVVEEMQRLETEFWTQAKN